MKPLTRQRDNQHPRCLTCSRIAARLERRPADKIRTATVGNGLTLCFFVSFVVNAEDSGEESIAGMNAGIVREVAAD